LNKYIFFNIHHIKMDNCYAMDELIKKYIESMTKTEQIAYSIAQKNLESSFDIEKSIGFKDFMKSNNYQLIQQSGLK
jgi:hypothetical protein